MQIEIVDGTGHLAEIKNLILEYSKFLGRDLSFQNLDAELADLAEKYAPPEGRILCAKTSTGEIVGCVAYHRHTAARCEMKRLFVKENFRQHHVGRLLIAEIINAAKSDGYAEMVLDTIEPLHGAIHLYKKFGFTETAPYYANPMADVIYMRKILQEGDSIGT